MKYSSRQTFPKYVGRIGLYSLVAVFLVILAVVAWVVIAQNNRVADQNLNSAKNQTAPKEYVKPSPSYNESTEVPDTEITENNVSDVPYEEPKVEEPAAPAVPAQAFQIPLNGKILKTFSNKELQKSATYNDFRLHPAMDIAAKAGSNVCSAGYGTVVTVEENAILGKTVVIDHRDGIILKYCGLDSIHVESGTAVEPGQVIGTVGIIPSECADPTHLHLEAAVNGEAVSPLQAIGLE
ncbi:MAG: M23 family metallopeptidase [Clostridia bacterium]|nr:M23 family metallopeptidase [Clostridia bacterium]